MMVALRRKKKMVALNASAVPEQAGPNLTQKLNESTVTCELLLFSYEISSDTLFYIFFLRIT